MLQTAEKNSVPFFVGTAAWTIPKAYKARFPSLASQLESYAQRLNAVEINSSFYRDHKASTYDRWAGVVPESFRFSVKLSKAITHEQRLQPGEKSLHESLAGPLMLGAKLGCLLVQLPPSLHFDIQIAQDFFDELRQCFQNPIVFEPRHPSWESEAARELLKKYKIARVYADPDPLRPVPELPSMQESIVYFRLHGSPEIYVSNYSRDQIVQYAETFRQLVREDRPIWCIFDNTTYGLATENALDLSEILQLTLYSSLYR